ncbi:MAG: hypothetical protein WCI63_03835 [bacterium]
MNNPWESKFNLPVGRITLVGKDCYWRRGVFYRDLRQTLSSQTDMNPDGTDRTRKISRKLLEIPDVRTVKLWGNTIFITVADGLSTQQAEAVVGSAMEILSTFNLYG